VSRNDHAESGVMRKGSDVPNLERSGSESLPFTAYRLEVRRPRQPPGGREAERDLRRQRTSTAASP
jgi:hypothetical protein